MLVEALVSMCMRLARRRWGLVHNVDFLIYGADIGEAFRVWAALEETLGSPVDVVPAEAAPPCLVAEVLTKGAVDWDYYERLLYLSVGQCQDVVRLAPSSKQPRRGLLLLSALFLF